MLPGILAIAYHRHRAQPANHVRSAQHYIALALRNLNSVHLHLHYRQPFDV
jgi:hypothetical protein